MLTAPTCDVGQPNSSVRERVRVVLAIIAGGVVGVQVGIGPVLLALAVMVAIAGYDTF